MDSKEKEILKDLVELEIGAIYDAEIIPEKYEKVKKKILDYDSKVSSINIRYMIERVYDAIDRDFGDNGDLIDLAFKLRDLCLDVPDEEAGEFISKLMKDEIKRRGYEE